MHDAEDEHDHDDFTSFHVDLGHFPSPGDLTRLLTPVLAAPEVLRLKGFAAIAGKPMRLAVQAVGQRLETYFDRPWTEDEQPVTRLVVIGGRDMDQPAIRAALAAA